jgi:hypothetical protein
MQPAGSVPALNACLSSPSWALLIATAICDRTEFLVHSTRILCSICLYPCPILTARTTTIVDTVHTAFRSAMLPRNGG